MNSCSPFTQIAALAILLLAAAVIPLRAQATAPADATAPAPATAPIAPRGAARFDSLESREIAPGVHHARGVDPDGPWHINILTIDLSRASLTIESARATDALVGRETTTSLARRGGNPTGGRPPAGNVIAAVNADFFDVATGEQLDHQVVAGRVVKGLPAGSVRSIAQFAVDAAGRPLIGDFSYAGSFAANAEPNDAGVRVALDGVNTLPPGANGLVLFDRWAGETVPADSLRRRARRAALERAGTRGDTVLFVRPNRRGDGIAIPDTGSAVLVGYGASAARLMALLGGHGASDTLRLVHRFAPVGASIRAMVGGRPILIEGGRNLATAPDSAGTFRSAFSTTRHPRTAVGILEDGHTVVLVTVDGRQESSVGMSLTELAALFADLGAREALNLDGGGSTTMVVRDTIVNRPSDAGGERTVANVLLVIEGQGPGGG